MKTKARVNREGFMGSATRVERPKKGKGSYKRNAKHKKNWFDKWADRRIKHLLG